MWAGKVHCVLSEVGDRVPLGTEGQQDSWHNTEGLVVGQLNKVQWRLFRFHNRVAILRGHNSDILNFGGVGNS